MGRISFKGAVDLLRQWLPQAAAYHDQPRKLTHWQEELLEAIASVQNPQRPGRREPRAKKRRPKNYQLLTKPRSQSMKFPTVNATTQRLNRVPFLTDPDGTRFLYILSVPLNAFECLAADRLFSPWQESVC